MNLEQDTLREWQIRHGPSTEDLNLHRVLLDRVEKIMPYTEFACLNYLGQYDIQDLGPYTSEEEVPLEDYQAEWDRYKDDGNPLSKHRRLVAASSWKY